MSPRDILATLHAMGATVTVVGNRLRVVGVALPEDLQAAIRVAKTELMQLVMADLSIAPLQAGEIGFTEVVQNITGMSLDRFEREGAPLEIRAPWLPVTVWFVPTESDADALLKEGVTRGRIWTATELVDIIALPDLTQEALQTIAYAKLEFDGDVIEVLPRVGQLPTTSGRDPESEGVPEALGEASSPRQRQDRIAGPWPDALPGLGPRTIVAYSPCTICGSGSWARFGETVLCLDCARAPRSLRLLRFRTSLRESWRLMAESSYADPAECQRCIVEVFSLETEIGEPLATILRRAWEDQWWTETKTCPTCGGAVRHSSETGEETDP